MLFIGGRAGVGKTSVAAEPHQQLAAGRIRHCLVEGDNLDQAWPVPHEHGLKLAEANLKAMWAAYREAGYSRVIYVNTAAIRSDVLGDLLTALGGQPVVHGVLLTASDATVAPRLAQREIGSALRRHLAGSRRAAAELDQLAPPWVRRIDTADRPVTELAQQIRTLLGWAPLEEDL